MTAAIGQPAGGHLVDMVMTSMHEGIVRTITRYHADGNDVRELVLVVDVLPTSGKLRTTTRGEVPGLVRDIVSHPSSAEIVPAFFEVTRGPSDKIPCVVVFWMTNPPHAELVWIEAVSSTDVH